MWKAIWLWNVWKMLVLWNQSLRWSVERNWRSVSGMPLSGLPDSNFQSFGIGILVYLYFFITFATLNNFGFVAEWLGRGLQNLPQRFESARNLNRLVLLPVFFVLIPKGWNDYSLICLIYRNPEGVKWLFDLFLNHFTPSGFNMVVIILL